ncbi:MAG: diguanylate cyclase [Acidihalobacter sp.]
MRSSLRVKLFLSHFAAILVVSGSVGTYFYFSARDTVLKGLQGRLSNSAALVGRSLEADGLDRIVSPRQITDPTYLGYLSRLRSLRASNPDIAYLYIMRRAGDKVYFVVDSDSTQEQALPGTVYDDVVPTLLKGFEHTSVDDQIYSDQRGSFLSGYAPLIHGDGRYLVGMDMRADEVERKFRRIDIAGLVSLGFSFMLALLFANYLSRRLNRPVEHLTEAIEAVGYGHAPAPVKVRADGEMRRLVEAYNDMAKRLAESQAEVERTRQSLESRVEERTRELGEANTRLRELVITHHTAALNHAREARTDELTGLYNRRAMLRLLKRLDVKGRRQGDAGYTLLLIDVDIFKQINDNHGHAIGDAVLREFARRLRTVLRGQDRLARWGGDEFLAALFSTPRAEAMAIAERLRASLADTPVLTPAGALTITLSIGVAHACPGEDVETCLQRADKRLYAAKQAGRNRVEPQGDDVED